MKSLTFRDRFRDRLGLVPKGGEISIDESKPIQKVDVPKNKSHDVSHSIDWSHFLTTSSSKQFSQLDLGNTSNNLMKTSAKITRKIDKPYDPYSVQTDFSPVYSRRLERKGKTEIFLPKMQKNSMRLAQKLPKIIEKNIKNRIAKNSKVFRQDEASLVPKF